MRAVDCMAGEMTAAAFGRLFGAGGALAPVLTILLTLYIAFFAISLLTGRATLGISALTPRMLTLGLVLTFATSWIAYQGVVWNLAVGGPDQIAGILMGAKGSATQIFADRIDIIFAAIEEISKLAGGGTEGQAQGEGGTFTPSNLMWLASLLLLLGTVGILVTARIALAVLLALGPVFVVFALFSGTRGLTAGWLRGVVLTAIVPLFVVLGGGLTTEMAAPVISALGGLEGINGRAAMALFLIASVHCALMIMVIKVATAIVSGWQVFGLGEKPVTDRAAPPISTHTVTETAQGQSVAAASGGSAQRARALASASGPAVETVQGQQGAVRTSERRTVVTHAAAPQSSSLPPIARQRARGIGSRFRAHSAGAGSRASREMIR
nr:type IV secretion system protein [Novosphingobium marinum]